MSYEKQTWATGDVITAEKLNHMEDGIESVAPSAQFVVTITDDGDDNYTADKTAADVNTAKQAGMEVVANYLDDLFPLSYVEVDRYITAVFDGERWDGSRRTGITITLESSTTGDNPTVTYSRERGWVVPNFSSADAGKVLTVDNSGSLVWASPSNA